MKKTLAVVLAFVLVIAMSVAGTFAYLTAKTEAVTNTFTAGKILDEGDVFELKEHKAERRNNGYYELSATEEVTGNGYTVLPGVDIAKDPFVRYQVSNNAYIFVEVVNNLPKGMTATVDSTVWDVLEGVKGPHDGKIYTLKDGKVTPVNANVTARILKDDQVVVDGTFVAGTEGINDLVFYGYLTQADSFDTPKLAWNATFGAPAKA